MKSPILLVSVLLLAGCLATHDRPMNESEETIASRTVMAMVEDAGGTLDTREDPKVRCERIRITGTHMVTRMCFTEDEARWSQEETMNRYYRRFGQQNRSREGG